MTNTDNSSASLSPLITQCPNCTTRFKVTEPQLQAARGKVRCGACLAVFEATRYLTQDGEPIAYEASDDLDDLLAEIEPVAMPGRADAVNLEDNADEVESEGPSGSDTDRDDPSGIASEQVESQTPESETTEALDALEKQLLADLHGETSDVEPGVSGGDAQTDLEESDLQTPGDAASGPATHDAETLTDFEEEADQDAVKTGGSQSAEAGPDETEDQTQDQVSEHSEQDHAREARAEEDLSEGHQPGEDQVEEDQTGEDQAGEDQAGEDQAEEDQVEKDQAEKDQAENASTEGDRSSESPQADDQSNQDSVAAYLFDVPEDPPKPRRPVLTFVLILLALLVLPAQVLWFQYEAWVKEESYRPIYAFICEVAGCTLPPMRDVAQIQSRRSISLSHEDKPGVRVVDVLMVNNAQFPQPFPLIELTFTNVDGQLVAGRRFQPQEYLHGELAGAQLMQPRTPVHVLLELPDPGPTAQGFRVVFR